MTDEQRQRLDRLADRCDDGPCNYEDFEAIRAALAEIDRLRAELDKAKADLAATDAHLDVLYAENNELSATIKGYENADPPRPAAIAVRLLIDRSAIHLFESDADAKLFCKVQAAQGWAVATHHIVWHSRKEGGQ